MTKKKQLNENEWYHQHQYTKLVNIIVDCDKKKVDKNDREVVINLLDSLAHGLTAWMDGLVEVEVEGETAMILRFPFIYEEEEVERERERKKKENRKSIEERD